MQFLFESMPFLLQINLSHVALCGSMRVAVSS